MSFLKGMQRPKRADIITKTLGKKCVGRKGKEKKHVLFKSVNCPPIAGTPPDKTTLYDFEACRTH